jgi:nitrate reductase (cytochrome), electron transfer subunit
MSSRNRDITALPLGFFLLASAVTAVVALGAAVKRATAAREREPAPAVVPLVVPPAPPISAEAQVFRTTPGMVALEPGAPRERSAHPRTLKTVHYLRGYPGAPPRIPHPLTAEEFRTDACRTCHERGGYSVRFSAYVPLTPHPERGICLQCHVGVDSVMGTARLDANPNARCTLCHGPNGGPPRPDVSLTWPTTVWPPLPSTKPGELPPPIPHDVPYRENCLTCHAGPAAVAEIRTSHPEWADCRQCHVALDPSAGVFTRPSSEVASRTGDAP